jgi:molybdopterin molybdotransferase
LLWLSGHGDADKRRTGGCAVISLEDAQRFVLARCRPLGTQQVPPTSALGRVSAQPVIAAEDVPPFSNSAMDGYAVRSADVEQAPTELTVITTIMAGDGRSVVIGPGEAARIMTGAPVPEGADAVCMVELTKAGSAPDRVMIEEAVGNGNFVRPPGSDVAAGVEVIGVGTELTAAHLGVIARLGIPEVTVHRQAVVGVLSTGDELREGSTPLPRGAIRDGNRPTLLAMVEQNGARAVDLGIVKDEPSALRSVLERASSECDAVVTSGGVSVGDLDVVRMVLAEMCPSMQWMQIAIRPAKPFAFGLLDERVPVIGLPGNPVSAMVSFELFARPALRLMHGHHDVERPRLAAVSDVDLDRSPDGKVYFLRVAASVGLDGQLHVRPSGGQDSHQLQAMAAANALAIVPDGHGVTAGDLVDVLLLDADRLTTLPA